MMHEKRNIQLLKRIAFSAFIILLIAGLRITGITTKAAVKNEAGLYETALFDYSVDEKVFEQYKPVVEDLITSLIRDTALEISLDDAIPLVPGGPSTNVIKKKDGIEAVLFEYVPEVSGNCMLWPYGRDGEYIDICLFKVQDDHVTLIDYMMGALKSSGYYLEAGYKYYFYLILPSENGCPEYEYRSQLQNYTYSDGGQFRVFFEKEYEFQEGNKYDFSIKEEGDYKFFTFTPGTQGLYLIKTQVPDLGIVISGSGVIQHSQIPLLKVMDEGEQYKCMLRPSSVCDGVINFSIEIISNPVTLSAEDLIIKDNQTHIHAYDITSQLRVTMKFYDNSVFEGTFSAAQGEFHQKIGDVGRLCLQEINGNWQISGHLSDDDINNQFIWKKGTSYEMRFVIADFGTFEKGDIFYEVPFHITVIDNPILEIQADDVSYYEGENAFNTSTDTGKQWMRYNPYPKSFRVITANKIYDSTDYSDFESLINELDKEEGIVVTSHWSETDQSYENQWKVGKHDAVFKLEPYGSAPYSVNILPALDKENEGQDDISREEKEQEEQKTSDDQKNQDDSSSQSNQNNQDDSSGQNNKDNQDDQNVQDEIDHKKGGFVDVKETAYYADAVSWAVSKGITTGTSSTTFSPDDECSRGQIVTFLWRAAGSPEIEAANTFTDVVAGKYYAKPVAWAVANKITTGTSPTTFVSVK